VKKLSIFVSVFLLFVLIHADNNIRSIKNTIIGSNMIDLKSIKVSGSVTVGLVYDGNLSTNFSCQFRISSDKYKIVSAELNGLRLKKLNYNRFANSTFKKLKPGKALTLKIGIKDGLKTKIITIATLQNPNFITSVTSPKKREVIKILPYTKINFEWKFSRETFNTKVSLYQVHPVNNTMFQGNISSNKFTRVTTIFKNNSKFTLSIFSIDGLGDRFRLSKYVEPGSEIIMKSLILFDFYTSDNRIHVWRF